MNKPKIQVILGSIRQGRSGEKVARWFMNLIKENADADFELVDLRDWQLPMFADPVSPAFREGQHENPDVQKWLDKISEADGYIIITPEYNHSYSSALKNNLDYAFKEWNNKAVGFIGYGAGAAGSRAVEHLRQVAGELAMYDVREQVLIPFIWQAFDEQGNLKNQDMYVQAAQAMTRRLLGIVMKLKS